MQKPHFNQQSPVAQGPLKPIRKAMPPLQMHERRQLRSPDAQAAVRKFAAPSSCQPLHDPYCKGKPFFFGHHCAVFQGAKAPKAACPSDSKIFHEGKSEPASTGDGWACDLRHGWYRHRGSSLQALAELFRTLALMEALALTEGLHPPTPDGSVKQQT